MTIPLVSIIIPCYRQGHFLGATVDSALAQSHRAVEVIVVNDGSDDRTDEVARGYGHRIKYVSQPNQGLAAARNTGIRASAGAYLLFLDSDDLLHPDAVAWQVEAAGGRDNVLCAMGYRRFEQVDEFSAEVLPPRVPSPTSELLTTCFGPPHSFFAPRVRVVATGGFNPVPPGCEDFDLWVRLVLAGCEVIPVYRAGAYYRQHPNSMSRNERMMARSYAHVLRQGLDFVRANPQFVVARGQDPALLVRRLCRQIGAELSCVGYHSRQHGQYWTALYYYLAGIRWGELGALRGVCKLAPHRLLRVLGRVQ